MYVVVEQTETVTAKADVEFPDRIERLVILQDEVALGDEGAYVFLWRTEREVQSESERQAPARWSLQWRGSLTSCLARLGEVHSDLILEQASARV